MIYRNSEQIIFKHYKAIRFGLLYIFYASVYFVIYKIYTRMSSVSSNINTIDMNVVSKIQQRLDFYDITSLVFLLYDIPYIALERLTLLQSISGEHSKNIDSLCDWVRQSQARNTWKYEFLEALSICQIYGLIREIGFDVEEVKNHFLPDNVYSTIYINPIKKVLYKICENIQSENFLKLKGTLNTYNINVEQYESCELIFLKLIVENFITIGTKKIEHNIQEPCDVENLVNILKNLPGIKRFALMLHEAAIYVNLNEKSPGIAEIKEEPKKPQSSETNYAEFQELDKIFEMLLATQHLTEPTVKLKADALKVYTESYPILNPSRIGICYIINQEKFYPSKESIIRNIVALENRKGTEKDEVTLVKTMKSYNFKVIVDKDLTHQQIKENIEHVVKNEVAKEDSVFALCILSHGTEGCFYGVDSVPVQVKDIQNILDGETASKLHKKPKILIIQACQGSQEESSTLVADGPQSRPQNLSHRPKSDFLTYWATVPEFLAFRDEKKGSIFIQMLCMLIAKFGKEEHLYDIFTKVNEGVTSVCESYNCDQVPVFLSTLRRKLYLTLPTN